MRHILSTLALLVLLAGCQTAQPSATKSDLTKTSAAPSKSEVVVSKPAKEVTPPTLTSHPVTVVSASDRLEGPWLEHLINSLPSKAGLRDLLMADSERLYKSSDFQPFLPKKAVSAGDAWPLEADDMASFLSQIYPNVQSQMNINGSGAYAVLRAHSADLWDISFRLHAQFVIDETIFITPAQFAGRLLINSKTGIVEYVSIAVPNDRPMNIAVEVHEGAWPVAVGSTSKMELTGGRLPSEETLVWSQEIPPAEANKLLAKEFYAFEKIPWLPLPQAFEEARKRKRPLFAIVIAGPLDDQSC